MKRFSFLLVVSAVVLAGCSQLVDDTDLSLATVQKATSDVLWSEDGSPVEGAWATLTTHSNGGTLSVHTNGLSAGHTYTLWWVIFNYPDACSGSCGEDDLFVDGDPLLGPDFDQIAAVGASVVFGAGHVVGNNGTATFATHLRAGQVKGDREVVLAPLEGPAGLLEPSTAEVHAVVRSHGPPIIGHVDEQISSFGGGCTPETGGDLPEGNDCMSPQFAVLSQ